MSKANTDERSKSSIPNVRRAETRDATEKNLFCPASKFGTAQTSTWLIGSTKTAPGKPFLRNRGSSVSAGWRARQPGTVEGGIREVIGRTLRALAVPPVLTKVDVPARTTYCHAFGQWSATERRDVALRCILVARFGLQGLDCLPHRLR